MTHDELLNAIVLHIDKLMNGPAVPALPDSLASVAGMEALHLSIVAIRAIAHDFSTGDLSREILTRGFLGGCFKTLQANLRHLTWQVQQVEKGDFSQRVEFLGDFSAAFNNMAYQLHSMVSELQEKEEKLLKLAESQRQEVELRKSAMLALRQSEAKFKYLAEHDPLTECLNRRSFFSLAGPALQNAILNGESCCIGLMDIDAFKVLNDTYGHLNGDTALQHVVKVSSARLRKGDIMGRYGGEEFIFFFSGADLDQGSAAAERIREAIKTVPMQFDSGESVEITVSIGVSVVFPEWPGVRDAYYLQQITGQADKALYRAKSEGRNKVCSADPTPPAPQSGN